MTATSRHIVVGISGASGIRYGMRFIETVVRNGWTVHLIVTNSGWRVMQEEEGLAGVGTRSPLTEWLRITPEQAANQIVTYNIRDIAAKPASGTFRAAAMVVIPASMKTCAGIAHGYSDDLLTRCADVFLKERRLAIVPRETPLGLIHLRNLVTLAEAGAHVIPAMPGFYCNPKTIDDLLDFMVMKVLNTLSIDHDIAMTWEGPRSEREEPEAGG
jgi:4-hydroxy-3-polyprenylbenzoate decarboxylase